MDTTCPNFARHCGGCPLLAVPYAQQLAQKQAKLQTLLGRFAPVEPVRGMAQPWHYRNKAIASFAKQRCELVCGLYAAGTHRVLPAAGCLLRCAMKKKQEKFHLVVFGRRVRRLPV